MKKTSQIRPTHTLFTTKLLALALGVLMILFAPQITATADAQNHSSHSNFYHGMAAVAEKELRDREKKEIAEKNTETEITAKITVDDENEDDSLGSLENTYSYDDED